MSTIEKDPSKELNAALADTLKGELAASGMTFDQLAAKTAISKRTLLRLLSTKERALKVDYIVAIASAFNLTAGEVFLAAEARLEREHRDGRAREA